MNRLFATMNAQRRASSLRLYKSFAIVRVLLRPDGVRPLAR
jgi:hypothetical protein